MPQLKGTGEVFLGDEEVATVDYNLSANSQALRDLKGFVSLIEGEGDFDPAVVLVLNLEDGRK